MRVVLVVIAIWFAVAFLLGPLVGRILKHGHIRPVGGPPAPEPKPEPEPDDPEPREEEGETRED